ncbi:DUF1800 domain-containing protein [Telmatobacter sp. DSM 110680]|uniref:DUF1800 domain-containing protein n=1 Tax=Telmatobacter sp. DSM 110680 TaxID=3036704 RepID=A0AAU7DEW6_9BACT
MQFFHGPLTAVLGLSLVAPAVPAQTSVSDTNQPPKRLSGRSNYHSTEIQGDARILHALNRFTFGPRPGDVDAVRTMGLDKWFDQQLHPATIGEVDLRARLAEFPAMQWNPQELLFRVPSNAIIRQALDGKIPVPERGALHAVYENQMYRVSVKKQEKEQKKVGEQAKPRMATDAVPQMAANAATLMAASNDQNSVLVQEPGSMDMNQMTAEKAAPATPVDDGQFRRMLDLAPEQRVQRLVAMQPESFEAFFKSLKQQQRNALMQDLSPNLKEVVLDLDNPQRLVNEEMIAQRLTHDIYANAQLQEVMTDFWLNHFNVFLHKNEATPYYLVSFERDVIRPRALGKFEDLLEATAHSPAMMLYLDNASSIGPDSMAAERADRRPNNKKKREGLNENYARELMELHTLGVNGGYSQADVTHVARILTGWTVERPERGGGFQFEPNRHEPGTKAVMGEKFKDHGEQEGRELLHMLATRPATAQFISRKLALRFVSDDPPQALVDRMAKTFLSTNGDIAAVLSTLFHAPEFWDANIYRAKVKTPVEFVVSAARAGNADIENMQPLANAVREMGMPLYGCVTPNGYSWQSDTWVSTNALVNRMNFALSLAANRLPGISIAWDPTANVNNDATMLQTNPASPDPQVEESRLEALLVSGGVSDSTRTAVLQQFEQQRNQIQNSAAAMPVAVSERQKFRARAVSDVERQDQVLAGLLLGSPEFQRR